MRPPPRSPPPDDFPSSPESAWSCTGSRSPCSPTQDHLSPPTPEPCFSLAPAIVTPDEFTLQLDVQFDETVGGSPHEPSTAHLLPRPSLSSSKTISSFLSEDDMSKVRWSLRNRDRGNVRERFETSPSLRPHNASRVPPVSRDSTKDAFSWEATRSPLVDPNELSDPSRYSRLIHEVSLLVGLAADDDSLSPGDRCPLVPIEPREAPDTLPLSLTPTKSRKHTNTNVQVPPLSIPIPPSTRTSTQNANATLHSEKPPLTRSGDPVTPVFHQRGADAVRCSLSPRRRQGRLFHFEPPSGNAHYRNIVDPDETFIHPREPPKKPILGSPTNRCSSLDRLECSLRKLEAHAPSNHRKSQSEGQSPDHVAPRKDKRPSLPPPQRLKKHQSAHNIASRNLSRPRVDCHLSCPLPVSRSTPLHHCAVPRTCPVVPLDDEHREEDQTPRSFMDMDIPPTEEASRKRQASFRQVISKAKMKSLVSVARRVSRGVIAWGKNLTGSAKPSVTEQETSTIHGAHG